MSRTSKPKPCEHTAEEFFSVLQCTLSQSINYLLVFAMKQIMHFSLKAEKF